MPEPATTITFSTAIEADDRNRSESELVRRQSTVAAVTDGDVLDSVGADKGKGGLTVAVSGAGELVKPRGLKAKAANLFASLKAGRRRSRASSDSITDSSTTSSSGSASTKGKRRFSIFEAIKARRRPRSTSSANTSNNGDNTDFATSGLFHDSIGLAPINLSGMYPAVGGGGGRMTGFTRLPSIPEEELPRTRRFSLPRMPSWRKGAGGK